ncbi:MAG: hypothetical protein ACXIVO_06725 [Glycocaulis sp.]
MFLEAVVAAVGMTLSGASDDVVIGRWCDRMVPNMPRMNAILEIKVSDRDGVIIDNSFQDGSSRRRVLEERGNEIYADTDSVNGDRYRIVSSTGDLQLIDNDGLIRTARRLENVPRAGECR